jgi:hypothetical protein
LKKSESGKPKAGSAFRFPLSAFVLPPMKKFKAGDRLAIPASDYNAMVDTTEALLRSRLQLLAVPGAAARERTVVAVTNSTSEEEDAETADWPIWSPVAVCLPEDQPIETGVDFSAMPFFPGYRLDDTNIPSFFQLGITQEPIPRGRTGRVCIRGPTFALMQMCPEDMSNSAGWEWVHVFKTLVDPEDEDSADRWTLRNGPAGDARLLNLVDAENPWEDGTYNDQLLALIDLCEVPQRVVVWNISGITAPAHSIMYRGITRHANKLGASTSAYHAWDYDLIATCGWDLEKSAWGWGYRFSADMPVKVNCGNGAQAGIGDWLGPASGSFDAWPELPGMRVLGKDWYKSGEPPRVWVVKNLRPFWAKADGNCSAGGSAWACNSGGSIVYDGTEQGGVTYPTVRASIAIPDLYDPSATKPRHANIQDGQIFQVSLGPVNVPSSFLAVGGVMDDPIGTVKIWVGAGAIPGGWREYGGLVGRFPVGYSSGDGDFGTFLGTGGSRQHVHDAGGYGLGGTDYNEQAAAHLPPFCTIKFIERYQ